ncbi:hypothetical protein D3C87_1488660 [compost metagenome]
MSQHILYESKELDIFSREHDMLHVRLGINGSSVKCVYGLLKSIDIMVFEYDAPSRREPVARSFFNFIVKQLPHLRDKSVRYFLQR